MEVKHCITLKKKIILMYRNTQKITQVLFHVKTTSTHKKEQTFHLHLQDL